LTALSFPVRIRRSTVSSEQRRTSETCSRVRKAGTSGGGGLLPAMVRAVDAGRRGPRESLGVERLPCRRGAQDPRQGNEPNATIGIRSWLLAAGHTKSLPAIGNRVRGFTAPKRRQVLLEGHFAQACIEPLVAGHAAPLRLDMGVDGGSGRRCESPYGPRLYERTGPAGPKCQALHFVQSSHTAVADHASALLKPNCDVWRKWKIGGAASATTSTSASLW